MLKFDSIVTFIDFYAHNISLYNISLPANQTVVKVDITQHPVLDAASNTTEIIETIVTTTTETITIDNLFGTISNAENSHLGISQWKSGEYGGEGLLGPTNFNIYMYESYGYVTAITVYYNTILTGLKFTYSNGNIKKIGLTSGVSSSVIQIQAPDVRIVATNTGFSTDIESIQLGFYANPDSILWTSAYGSTQDTVQNLDLTAIHKYVPYYEITGFYGSASSSDITSLGYIYQFAVPN